MISINKDNLDNILKEIANEYRILSKNSQAEIILVGGASIIAQHFFRDSTTDFDADVFADSIIKAAVNRVGDRNGFENNWFNSDFERTVSNSPRLRSVSKFYKAYNNGKFVVRILPDEYAVAMKLRSFRQYKRDKSDIIGIIKERNNTDKPLTYEQIKNAVEFLYDDFSSISKKAQLFLEEVIKTKNLDELYEHTINIENENKNIILYEQKKNPKSLQEESLDDIINCFSKTSTIDDV